MQRHANGNYIAATKNVAFKMKSASTVGSKLMRRSLVLRWRLTLTIRGTQTTTTRSSTASCSTEVSASKSWRPAVSFQLPAIYRARPPIRTSDFFL
jgi:hypothetical protein